MTAKEDIKDRILQFRGVNENLESENLEDTPVDLRYVLTGAHLTLKLPAQHALALIVKQEKSVIAKYASEFQGN